MRDSLSLLDQAIAHAAADGCAVSDVREMLGLSDRGDIIALFAHAMRGEIARGARTRRRMYHAGADASEMLIELAEFCHLVTRISIANAAPADPSISEIETPRGGRFAQSLALGQLTRAWTMLFKGVEDIKDSPRPLASLEMTLIRLAYAADLPGPEDALRKLAESGGAASRAAAPSAPAAAPSGGRARRSRRPRRAAPAAGARPPTRAAPRELRGCRRARPGEARRANAACAGAQVRLARFEPGRIEFTLVEGASPALAQTLTRKLAEWTGERWLVALVQGATAPTLRESAERARG